MFSRRFPFLTALSVGLMVGAGYPFVDVTSGPRRETAVFPDTLSASGCLTRRSTGSLVCLGLMFPVAL